MSTRGQLGMATIICTAVVAFLVALLVFANAAQTRDRHVKEVRIHACAGAQNVDACLARVAS